MIRGENLPFDQVSASWLEQTCNELDRDAVGLWELVQYLRHAYGLRGAELEQWTRRGIVALLDRGAVPIRGNRRGWLEAPEYGTTAEEISAAIVAEWVAMHRDPDVEDVWFGLPQFLKENHG